MIRDLLLDLVQIPSPTGQEKQLADYIAGLLVDMGLDVERIGDNIIARRGQGRPRLLLNTHLDTVPGHIEPRVEGDRMFGRGSVDAKAGIAAILTALERTKESSVPLEVAFVVDEEVGHTGVEDILPYLRAEMGVVMEPTSLEIVTGHKGRVVLEVETRGKSGHASEPWNAINAIEDMARIITGLKVDLLVHPVLGRETLAFTTIEGGGASNVVPDCCRAVIDYRFVPPNTPESVRAHVKDAIESIPIEGRVDVGLQERGSEFTAPLIVHDPRIIELMTESMRRAGIEPSTNILNACTDAAYIARVMPTVVFGPGSIEVAHTADEWVDLWEIEAAANILIKLIGLVGA